MPNNPLKSMWDTHQKTLILSLIFFVALLLRLFGLSQESLWNDELATWLFTRRSSLLEVIKMAGLDRSPPLYQLLISIHTSMFGDSEWSLRFPSVVFSLLSMGALYVWVKEFYQEKVALLAVGLMAIMYVPIYFAQEARNYSLLILLSILSFHASALILKEISDRQTQIFNWRPYLFLSLTSLALCYTHYFGLLLVLVQGLVLIAISAIYRNPFHLTKLIIGYGLVGLLYLPWFSYIYPEAISNMDFWIPKPNRYSFWEVFQYFFNDSIILSVVAFFTCLFFVGIRVFDQ